MIDRRWQIRSSCNMTVVGAGTAGVAGKYCEVAPFDGKRMWVKYGTIGFANAIFWSATQWVMQRNGSVMYETTDELPTADGPVPTAWTTAVLGSDPAPESSVSDGWQTVDAIEFAGFSSERDHLVSLAGHRAKPTRDIVFVGDEYRMFLSMYRDPSQRCIDIPIRRQWRCSGMWQTAWMGTFSPGSGRWDYDLCQFSVKPETEDIYSCIVRQQKQKFNILQVSAKENITKLVPTVDFLVCTSNTPEDGPLCEEIGSDPENPDIAGGWEFLDDIHDNIDGIPTTFYFYWREIITTECIDGLPVPPPGTGWILYVSDCVITGTAQYVRPTQGAYPYGTPTQGTYDGYGNPVPPDDTCAWLFIGNARAVGTTDTFAPYFVCTTIEDESDIHLDRGRLMKDVVLFFLEKMGCQTTELVSDFFEWNPVGDAPGYVPGMNYVTGLPNQMTDLLIYQKSDITDYASTNPAAIGDMTFDELMNFFRVCHRVYWFIDSRGRFRLEHYTYLNAVIGLDITQRERSEPMAFDSISAEIPAVERAKWMEAGGRDFVGLDIVYSGPCVNPDTGAVTQWNPGEFSTDVVFVINPGNNAAKTGFLVLACKKIGDVYYTIVDYGKITDNFITNAPMSWANLQDAFWRSDRYRPTGKMNGVETEFDSYLPNIEQKGVVVKLCCDYLSFDSSQKVSTALGNVLGSLPAFVRRADFDEATESLTLTLRYQQ